MDTGTTGWRTLQWSSPDIVFCRLATKAFQYTRNTSHNTKWEYLRMINGHVCLETWRCLELKLRLDGNQCPRTTLRSLSWQLSSVASTEGYSFCEIFLVNSLRNVNLLLITLWRRISILVAAMKQWVLDCSSIASKRDDSGNSSWEVNAT